MEVIKLIPLDGCIWCPHHTKYSRDDKKQGRCNKVTVRKGNSKLIRYEELAVIENGQLQSFRKFPEWCPLETKQD